MTEFFSEYAMFAAKGISTVIFILLAAGGVMAILMQSKQEDDERLEIKKMNEHFDHMGERLKQATLSDKAYKKALKALKQKRKQDKKVGKEKRIFVLNFHGDIHANAVASLRECITAVLSVADGEDEVLVLLESAGGAVHDYGFAASQLQRIRKQGIHLVIAVDKIAASGGYMMACVADKIIAAPFAIIGSVGVIAQLPNFNKLLKKMDIDFEQMTAGEYKRTMSLFGENTEKGRQKAQQDIDETHALFKQFVVENRPDLNMTEIATGEHWYGAQAIKLHLVDELSTSDDYLLQASHQADIFNLSYKQPQGILSKLFSAKS